MGPQAGCQSSPACTRPRLRPVDDSVARPPALRKHRWRALATNGAVFVALLGLFAYWMRDPWLFVLTLGLSALGVLAALDSRVSHIFRTAVAAYFMFTWWAFIALLPVLAAFGVGRLVIERRSGTLQAAVLIAWGCILAPLLFVIFTSERRTWLFSTLQRLGGLAPYVYAWNVLLLAMLFFGTLTTILQDQGALALVGPRERIYDFFLWHTLDSVPGLKVNETLRWTVPMTYQQGRVGLLVLLYKAVVLAPVVAAFIGYRRHVAARAAQGT
jgi:hypothetical protein